MGPLQHILAFIEKRQQYERRTLEKAGMNVAIDSGTKIGEMIQRRRTKTLSETNTNSVVYEIPCKGCSKSYVGETGRGVSVRLKEHKSDVKFHRTSNAIVLHIENCNHLPDWDRTRVLEKNSDSIWLRYVDDVLVVVPKNMDLEDKLRQMNSVNEKIQFTIEMEQNGQLPFLDTCIMKSESRFKFKVFRKPSNKEDYVHFYSGHSDRVKSGIVIGFFFRAFRVCDEEFLNDEIEHIYTSFMKLKYPKGFLIKQKEIAKRIRNRTQKERKTDESRKRKWLSIPNFKEANDISRTLEKAGMNVAIDSGTKIGEMIQRRRTKTLSETNTNSVVYEIPCKGCSKSYVGETGRGVSVRLKEHKSDVKFHRTSNAIVLHIENCNHLPDWDRTRVLEKNVRRQKRKILEAAHILSRETFNVRSGFIALASGAVRLAVGG